MTTPFAVEGVKPPAVRLPPDDCVPVSVQSPEAQVVLPTPVGLVSSGLEESAPVMALTLISPCENAALVVIVSKSAGPTVAPTLFHISMMPLPLLVGREASTIVHVPLTLPETPVI